MYKDSACAYGRNIVEQFAELEHINHCATNFSSFITFQKLDADADNGNRFMSNRGDLQIFNPADYLSCYTSNMKTSNSTEVNSMSSAMGACCLDDLNNITISNHHPTSSSKSGVGNQVTDQLLLDDDELCLS